MRTIQFLTNINSLLKILPLVFFMCLVSCNKENEYVGGQLQGKLKTKDVEYHFSSFFSDSYEYAISAIKQDDILLIKVLNEPSPISLSKIVVENRMCSDTLHVYYEQSESKGASNGLCLLNWNFSVMPITLERLTIDWNKSFCRTIELADNDETIIFLKNVGDSLENELY